MRGKTYGKKTRIPPSIRDIKVEVPTTISLLTAKRTTVAPRQPSPQKKPKKEIPVQKEEDLEAIYKAKNALFSAVDEFKLVEASPESPKKVKNLYKLCGRNVSRLHRPRKKREFSLIPVDISTTQNKNPLRNKLNETLPSVDSFYDIDLSLLPCNSPNHCAPILNIVENPFFDDMMSDDENMDDVPANYLNNSQEIKELAQPQLPQQQVQLAPQPIQQPQQIQQEVSQPVSPQKPKQISKQIPKEVSLQVPQQKIPKQIIQEVSQPVPLQKPQQISKQILQEVSLPVSQQKIPKQILQEVPQQNQKIQQIPQQILQDVSQQQKPPKIPQLQQILQDVSQQVPPLKPQHILQEGTQQVPPQKAQQVPQEILELQQKPQQIPQEVTQQIQELPPHKSQLLPQLIPQDVSQQKPQQIPQEVLQQVHSIPQEVLQQIHQQTPQHISQQVHSIPQQVPKLILPEESLPVPPQKAKQVPKQILQEITPQVSKQVPQHKPQQPQKLKEVSPQVPKAQPIHEGLLQVPKQTPQYISQHDKENGMEKISCQLSTAMVQLVLSDYHPKVSAVPNYSQKCSLAYMDYLEHEKYLGSTDIWSIHQFYKLVWLFTGFE